MNGVEAAGLSVNRAQLSRTAQKALGWDNLARAQDSVENMWLLQDTILAAMKERDASIEATGKFTLVERTPADMIGYTRMWCRRLGIDATTDLTFRNFFFDCMDMSKRYAAIIIVPMIPQVAFVEEPNRADLASRVPVDADIRTCVSHMAVNHVVMAGITPEERVAETVAIIRGL